MKMSDVFCLPLNSDYDTVNDRNLKDLAAFDTCEEDEAAAHAINQHDQLVAINQELIETLEFQLGNDYIHQKTKDEIRHQIKRAKELTK